MLFGDVGLGYSVETWEFPDLARTADVSCSRDELNGSLRALKFYGVLNGFLVLLGGRGKGEYICRAVYTEKIGDD